MREGVGRACGGWGKGVRVGMLAGRSRVDPPIESTAASLQGLGGDMQLGSGVVGW